MHKHTSIFYGHIYISVCSTVRTDSYLSAGKSVLVSGSRVAKSSPQERLPNYCPDPGEVAKLLAAASVSEEGY